MSTRRLPSVAPWAEPFIDPEPSEGTYEEPRPKRRQQSWLAERVHAQQAEYREKAAVYKRACWENLAVWFVLTLVAVWLPSPWSAICWVVAVGFGCLSCAQWISWLTNRRAARMYPDPEDLVLRF